MGKGDSSSSSNNNNSNDNINNKRASIPTSNTTNSDIKKQTVVSTSATGASILSSTAVTANTIDTAKATATDNIAELKSENSRLQKLVNTQKTELTIMEEELITKGVECQRLRDENKLLKDRASSSSSSSSVAAASVNEGQLAATTATTVEQVLSIPSVLVSLPVPALAPATTAVSIFVSSSAVADVMVEEGTYNGILSKIFEYVIATTVSRKRKNNNNGYDDDGNETLMPGGETTTTLDELMNLTLVSKRFCKIMSTHEENGTKKWTLTLFVLSPNENNEDEGRTLNFIHNMNQYKRDEDTHKKLQRYSIFKVENMEQFDDIPVDKNMNGMEMKGIRSLEMSSLPSVTMVSMSDSLPRFLSCMMPNLHELKLFHTNFHASILDLFFTLCRRLEKITWTNINSDAIFLLDGSDMEYARNLKEINMDDSNFHIWLGEDTAMSDLDNQPTIFLFHKCGSTVLERVSIRNAKCHKYNNNTFRSVSQNMLVKFIRNAPATLKWFRSDLTQVNIEMLTKERPGIQLLN